MPEVPEEVQSLARRVASTLRELVGAEAEVWWFGSWIDGQPVERSDVDLAVDLGRPLTPAERAGIDLELEGLPTLRRVDVVDLRAVTRSFRERVVRGGTPL